jgi:hypothetical protein
VKCDNGTRRFGYSAAFCLLTTALFFVLYLKGPGPADSADEALSQIADPGPRFYATYVNAVLGIPSTAFGTALLGNGLLGNFAGVSLTLSAIADAVGFAGVMTGNEKAGFVVIIGAFLFLVSLVALTMLFLENDETQASAGGAR